MPNDKEIHDLLKRMASEFSAGSSQQSGVEQVLEVVELSPATAKAARRLFDVLNLYQTINEEMEIPEAREFLDTHMDVRLLPKMGYAAMIFKAYEEFVTAAEKFLADPKNHYNSDQVRRRYKKIDDLQAYANKYRLFESRVQAVRSGVDVQLPAWMRVRVQREDVGGSNRFVQRDGIAVGETLHAFSQEFAARREEELTYRQYTELCSLFLWQVSQERAQSDRIERSHTNDDETLAKLLYELAAGTHRRAIDAADRLPKVLAQAYKEGQPLFHVLVAFFQQFPEALTSPDHPGHEATVLLMSELNQFVAAEAQIPEALQSQPFSYQFSYGLVLRDAVEQSNYQEFVVNLHQLSETADSNQEWYRSMAEYVMIASRTFAYNIVFHSQDLETVVFDTEKELPEMNPLGDSLYEILSVGQSTQVTVVVSGERLPIDRVPVRGTEYMTYLHARKVARGSYIVNVEIMLRDEQKGETILGPGFAKYRYQVRVDQGVASVYMPVVDRDQVTPAAELTAIEHVQYIFSLVSEEVRQSQKAQTKLIDATVQAKKELVRKSNKTREERIAEYEAKKAASAKNEEPFVIEVRPTRPAELSNMTAAEEDAVSPFLPQEIIISDSMRREMEKQRKKGAYSRIYGLTIDFINRYNAAGSQKPGKGHQMTDVYGPENENVWRFKVTYSIRCVAVDLGNGQALLVDADDHDDAYGDVTDINKRVAREVTKYRRETGQD